MVKGFHDSTAGLMSRAVQQETVANNLANVETDGYRAQRVAFRNLLDSELTASRPGGTVDSWQQVEAGRYDIHSQGALQATGNSLDLAIEGQGWFAVDTGSGIAYTRNGNFSRDADGKLVTAGGHTVRLEGGGSVVLPSGAEVAVAADGSVRVNEATVGKLELVKASPTAKLERLGDNLVRFTSEQPTAGGVSVLQGSLENSNVNALREMVDMISISRQFESLSKSLTTTDDSMRVAINDVGRTV